MPYTALSFAAAKAALALRLSDPGMVFYVGDELGIYLCEGLKVWNALTASWTGDQEVAFAPGDGWKSIAQSGLRLRSTTDANLATEIEYHLLEPATGLTWTGTDQFGIADVEGALERRVNELLQLTAASVEQMAMPVSTQDSSQTLSPTTLALSRVRWIPTKGSSYPLFEEDRSTLVGYGNQVQQVSAPPESWYTSTLAPLTFDLDSTPDQNGTLDMLVLGAQASLTPPDPTIINLPNDWAWVAKWGAISDMLSKDPESTDNRRAKYALERYKRGVKAMQSLPWLIGASIAGVIVDTPSVVEMDGYAPDWENSGDPQIVVGGMDLVATSPFTATGDATVSAILTLVMNAPLPVGDGDALQLPPDAMDQVLNYAEHIARFKQGGDEFAQSIALYEQFEMAAATANARYNALGIARQPILMEGDRGSDISPRFTQSKDE